MARRLRFAQQCLKEVSKSAYHRLGQARKELGALKWCVSEVNATDGRFDEAADHFAKAMEVRSPWIQGLEDDAPIVEAYLEALLEVMVWN